MTIDYLCSQCRKACSRLFRTAPEAEVPTIQILSAQPLNRRSAHRIQRGYADLQNFVSYASSCPGLPLPNPSPFPLFVGLFMLYRPHSCTESAIVQSRFPLQKTSDRTAQQAFCHSRLESLSQRRHRPHRATCNRSRITVVQVRSKHRKPSYD